MSEMQKPDLLARVREIALLLPGAHEAPVDDATLFLVDGRPFAKLDTSNCQLTLRSSADADAWSNLALDEATDWTLVEDGIARSWELSAPAGLLEAGGR